MDDGSRRGPIVWIAGVGWDDNPGTDKRMVMTLARSHRILWIDSPRRGVWDGWFTGAYPAVESVHPGVIRLRAPGPPGFSRWPVRYLTGALQRHTLTRHLVRGQEPVAVVVANPVWRFPRAIAGPRIYYATDDWVAGASLMGFGETVVRETVTRNVSVADAIASVTPELSGRLATADARDAAIAVIPNGAPAVRLHPDRLRDPVACLIGQLNERLDLGVLEAVVDAGVALRIMGQRTDTSSDFGRRLDALLRRPEVRWFGSLSAEDLSSELARVMVGLTPYARTAFNEASFPLKTLEYLAAGIPVVSTELSASTWLNSKHVVIANSAGSFAASVVSAIARGDDPGAIQERLSLARRHSWDRRADQFCELIGSATAVYRRRATGALESTDV